MNLKKRITHYFFVAVAVLILLISKTFAQSSEEVATGLVPPNASQVAEMARTMVRTWKVLPNKLALQRLNAERLMSGVPSSFEKAAPMGGEVLSTNPSVGPTTPTSDGMPSVGSAVLPSRVDNSTLPAFPPIRSQGGIGSCSAFSATYTVGTHMLALARGTNSKDISDNATKLSPKFTYAMVNWGKDTGSWFSDIIKVMIRFGVPTWEKWPYSGDPKVTKNYLEWPTTADVWRNAVNNRFDKSGTISNIHTPQGLQNAKALLANGYLLLFATDIMGWQYADFQNDPSTSLDDNLVGKKVCWMIANAKSGHAMTIVGYDDNAWVDINKNGVVDSGEKGALKIANSWGTDWQDSGFTWIAYDALQLSSAVSGVDNTGRIRPQSGEGWLHPFWYNEVYWITARAGYSPKLLAEFTLNHESRSQLRMRLATSSVGTPIPQTFSPHQDFDRNGGSWGFDGGANPVDGTFIFDFTDLYKEGAQRYFLTIDDNASGSPAAFKSYNLTSPSGAIFSTATIGVPSSADKSTAVSYIDFGGAGAPQISSQGTISGRVGQALTCAVAATNTPTSFAANGLPPGLMMKNSSDGVISGVPTQAGSFTSSVSASNGSGTETATMKFEIASSDKAVPVIVSSQNATARVGEDFKYQIAATNGPEQFAAAGLPPGLSCDSKNGLITGKPDQSGVSAISISATNSGGTGSKILSLSVQLSNKPLPEITSKSSAEGKARSPFTYRIEATNNPTSFSADDLPTGLEINEFTGVISGVLPTPRVNSITLRAKNNHGSSSKQLILTVSESGAGVSTPSNDIFANSASIVGSRAKVYGTNQEATMEPGERSHGNQGSHSVWWRWTSPRNSKVVVSTAGSSLDTVLSVYTGDTLESLQLIAENDNSATNITSSRVDFLADMGKTYYFAIDGNGSSQGDILLSVEQEKAAPPANDNFQKASVLSGPSVKIVGSNLDATAEENESQHMGQPATKSVWWSWTAPANGHVKIDTVGSTFDTIIAVYQNLLRPNQEIQVKGAVDFVHLPENSPSPIHLLSKIAEDDESGGQSTSKVSFSTIAGTTYHFAVDGRYGVGGVLNLNLDLSESPRPANDDFLSATSIGGAPVRVSLDTSSSSAEGNEPRHAGQAAARSVWWYWTPDVTGPVRITTAESDFDTILAVYTGSTLQNLRKVASNDDSAGGKTSAVEFPASKGNVYYIAVDGHDISGGRVDLQIAQSASPLNDNFANRAEIRGNNIQVSASNSMATKQDGEPEHSGENASKSLWWTWKSDYTAPVRISTVGSDFDTVLAVYSGGEIGGLKPIVSNNNINDGLTSTVWFLAEQGKTYQIAVAGQSDASGSLELSLSQDDEGVAYQTGFDYFPIGNNALHGIDGWIDSDAGSGATGTFELEDGSDLGAWIGFNKPTIPKVTLKRIVNLPKNSTIVEFGVDFSIEDSSAGRPRDSFSFEINNIGTPGKLIAGVLFDNSTGKIVRLDGIANQPTGIPFMKSSVNSLDAVINLPQNLWSVYLNGVPVFINQVFSASANDLHIGGIDVVWSLANPGNCGDNYMAFDNYWIATSNQAPSVTGRDVVQAVVGEDFQYRIEANPAPDRFMALDLPPGLSLDSSTGWITGKPLKAVPCRVMLAAAKGESVGSKMLAINIKNAPPVITSSLSISGQVGVPFSYKISADNSPTLFNFTNYPTGMSVDYASGTLSGTPFSVGTYQISMEARNESGADQKTLTLTILPPSGGGGGGGGSGGGAVSAGGGGGGGSSSAGIKGKKSKKGVAKKKKSKP